MKMVTKRFKKTSAMLKVDIDRLVTLALCDEYQFLYRGAYCEIWSGLQLRARCLAPREIQSAWFDGDAITFSVTLPAECWRKP